MLAYQEGILVSHSWIVAVREVLVSLPLLLFASQGAEVEEEACGRGLRPAGVLAPAALPSGNVISG